MKRTRLRRPDLFRYWLLFLLFAGVWGSAQAAPGEPGTLVVWGDREPAAVCDVVAFSAGVPLDMAITSSGARVSFEGQPWDKIENVEPLSDVALGTSLGIGLRRNGSVVGLSLAGFGGKHAFEPPVPIFGIALANRSGLALVLQGEGSVVQWSIHRSIVTNVTGITNAVAISAGLNHFAALLGDGSVLVWSINSEPTLKPPILQDIKAIAVSASLTLALRRDGTVVKWGAGPAVPAGLQGVTAIAAGDAHYLALKQDGTVVAWGDNSKGQLEVPANLKKVIAIGAGPQSSMAISAQPEPSIISHSTSRTVLQGRGTQFSVTVAGLCPHWFQWIHNGNLILGANESVLRLENLEEKDEGLYEVRIVNHHGSRTSPAAELLVTDVELLELGNRGWNTIPRPSHLGEIASVAAGSTHDLALRTDGTVIAWGSDSFGQCRPPNSLTGVVMVAAGSVHSVALRQDGTVVAWGDPARSAVPSDLKPVKSIAVGFHHTIALQVEGTVRAWNPAGTAESPELRALTNIVMVGGGQEYTATLDGEGKVRVFTNGPVGLLSPPADLPFVKSIATGGSYILALLEDGTVRGWGGNKDGQLNVPLGLSEIVSLSAANTFAVALRKDGQVFFWGSWSTPKPALDAAFQIAAGHQHCLVLTQPSRRPAAPRFLQPLVGRTVMAGSEVVLQANVSGTPPLTFRWLRNGRGWSSSEILRLTADETTDGFFSVVVRNAWGEISSPQVRLGVLGVPSGQLIGWGNNTSFATRVAFAMDNVRAASVGSDFMVALKQDGTVVARGLSPQGQTNVPVGLREVVAVAAGDRHALALREDGTVVAWGDNSFGQGSVPPGIQEIIGIAAGSHHNLAWRADGTLVSWGNPAEGATAVPAQISNVVAIAAGGANSAVLRADGIVEIWGDHTFGQTRSPPFADVQAVALGRQHVVVLRRGGTVACWGRNDSGQASPPDGLTNLIAIAAGESHSLALTRDGNVVMWGADNTTLRSNFPSDLRGGAVAIAAGRYHSVGIKGPPAPLFSLRQEGGRLLLNLKMNLHWRYQLEDSIDLQNWVPSGQEFLATEPILDLELGLGRVNALFHRLRSVP